MRKFICFITLSVLSVLVYAWTPESAPKIQDTFLGIKLGSTLTASDVKSAIGERGEFIMEKVYGQSRICIFRNVMFAGKEWHSAMIFLSSTGEFYLFGVIDTFPTYASQEMIAIYDDFASRLSRKYPNALIEGEKDAAYDEKLMYAGSNGVGLNLMRAKHPDECIIVLQYLKMDTFISIADAIEAEL